MIINYDKYYDGFKQGNFIPNYPRKEKWGEGPSLNMMDKKLQK